MNGTRALLLLIVGLMISTLVCFRAMNAMMVRPDSIAFVRPNACPQPLDDKGLCLVHGSISRSFVMEDVEIGLPDGSTLLLRPDQVVGSSSQPGKARYEPFGALAAFVLGALILLSPMLAWIAAIHRAGRRRPEA